MEQNFNLYHVFYVTARCSNITRAANELFISQPAISKAISKLERNLGTTLFTRSSRGVQLTESGELLYRQVEHAFQAISQGEEQLRRVKELDIGKLSIGASTTLCKYMLLPYLKEFTKEFPHIQISISCQSSFQTIHALEKGQVDIGLIGETDQSELIVFEKAREIEDIFVTTESYLDNLKMRTGISDSDLGKACLSKAVLMLLNKENITRQYVDRFLAVGSLRADQLIEVTSMDLLIEFAKTGLGIACVISNFVSEELQNGSLIQLKLPVKIPKRSIGFAYQKNISPTPSMQHFLEFCHKFEG